MHVLADWPWLPASAVFIVMLALRVPERRRAFLSLLLLALSIALYYLARWLDLEHDTGSWLSELFLIVCGMVQIRIAGLGLFRVLLPLMRLSPPRILEDVLVAVAYFAWWLARLKAGGLELSGLITTSAVVTAVIGFSMQDTLGNVLAGMALQFDESIEIDQWVRINDLNGRVIQIGWRSTTLMTRNGERVILPNQLLMKSPFVIVGREEGAQLVSRRWIWFDVDWSLSPARVVAAADAALKDAEIAGVARLPAPHCVLMEWKEGVARYALRYWLSDIVNDDPTDSLVRQHLFASLARDGIALCASGHSILLTHNNQETEARLAAGELRQRHDALSHVHLFAGLMDDELTRLAGELIFAPFAAGDVITRQGANAHWLYILTRGEVAIWHDHGAPGARLLATLNAPDFFGEMGLMTGSPRSATVIAMSEVECWRLNKQSFARILDERPEIAQQVSTLLSERLSKDRVPLDEQVSQPHTNEVLRRMRAFFGLA